MGADRAPRRRQTTTASPPRLAVREAVQLGVPLRLGRGRRHVHRGRGRAARAPDDPYAVLGVRSTATWDEIVAAHRQLAKLHHPDRLQEAGPDQRASSETTMRLVNAAYRELQARFKPSS